MTSPALIWPASGLSDVPASPRRSRYPPGRGSRRARRAAPRWCSGFLNLMDSVAAAHGARRVVPAAERGPWRASSSHWGRARPGGSFARPNSSKRGTHKISLGESPPGSRCAGPQPRPRTKAATAITRTLARDGRWRQLLLAAVAVARGAARGAPRGAVPRDRRRRRSATSSSRTSRSSSGTRRRGRCGTQCARWRRRACRSSTPTATGASTTGEWIAMWARTEAEKGAQRTTPRSPRWNASPRRSARSAAPARAARGRLRPAVRGDAARDGLARGPRLAAREPARPTLSGRAPLVAVGARARAPTGPTRSRSRPSSRCGSARRATGAASRRSARRASAQIGTGRGAAARAGVVLGADASRGRVRAAASPVEAMAPVVATPLAAAQVPASVDYAGAPTVRAVGRRVAGLFQRLDRAGHGFVERQRARRAAAAERRRGRGRGRAHGARRARGRGRPRARARAREAAEGRVYVDDWLAMWVAEEKRVGAAALVAALGRLEALAGGGAGGGGCARRRGRARRARARDRRARPAVRGLAAEGRRRRRAAARGTRSSAKSPSCSLEMRVQGTRRAAARALCNSGRARRAPSETSPGVRGLSRHHRIHSKRANGSADACSSSEKDRNAVGARTAGHEPE